MGNGTDKSAEIERLLEERVTVLQWLDRLSMATADTPESVRLKVKADYEARLEDVSGKLNGYTGELQRSLDGHQAVRTQLLESEGESETRLAEAKLRHAVGEFPESQWNELHSEILAELVQVREGLKKEDEEIQRLEEVLATIQARPAPAPPPEPEPPAPPPSPAAEPVLTAAPAPAPPREQGSVDELAFLKSVTPEERAGPAAAHAAADPVHVPPPPEPAPPPPPPSAVESGGAGPKKTLKCGECGVMNFPTEWYCERCGAELAAL